MPLRYPLANFRSSGYQSLTPNSHTTQALNNLKAKFARRRVVGVGGGKRLVFNEFLFLGMFMVTSLLIYNLIGHYDEQERGGAGQMGGAGRRSLQVINAKARADRLRSRAKERSLDRRGFMSEAKKFKEPTPLPGAKISLAARWEEKTNSWGTGVLLDPKEVYDGAQELGVAEFEYVQIRCSDPSITPDEADNLFANPEPVTVMPVDDCVTFNLIHLRKQRIQSKCTRAMKSRDYDSNRFLVMKYRKLVWCPVFKAASTNWMTALPKLSNFSPQQLKEVQKLLRQYSQANELARFVARPLEEQNFKYFLSQKPKPVSFIIVRHPLDRLISAYRDKLEVYNEHYYNLYGRDIVERFRPRGKLKFGEAFYDSNGTNGTPVPNPNRDGRQPTFWEFCMSIIELDLLDDHWKPISSTCSLCRMNYDIIIKYENLEQEQSFMLRNLGIGPKILASNLHGHENPQKINKMEKLKYLKMLNPEEMNEIHRIYKEDFELLGYEHDLPGE